MELQEYYGCVALCVPPTVHLPSILEGIFEIMRAKFYHRKPLDKKYVHPNDDFSQRGLLQMVVVLVLVVRREFGFILARI